MIYSPESFGNENARLLFTISCLSSNYTQKLIHTWKALKGVCSSFIGLNWTCEVLAWFLSYLRHFHFSLWDSLRKKCHIQTWRPHFHGGAVTAAGSTTTATAFYLDQKWEEHFCVSVTTSSLSVPPSSAACGNAAASGPAFDTYVDLTILRPRALWRPLFFPKRRGPARWKQR